MAAINIIFNIIYIILLRIIILNFVKSEVLVSHSNATSHDLSWKSDRIKRSFGSIMPAQLKLKVKSATGEEIELKWNKQIQFLANEHVPVITPILDFNPFVLRDIGEFVVYHDVEKQSAVVFFRESNTFHGVIGTNYYIKDLPYNFDQNGDYLGGHTERYVLKYDNSFTQFLINTDITPLIARKRPSDSNSGPSNKYQHTHQDFSKRCKSKKGGTQKGDINLHEESNNYYLEIIVFVARDVVEIFEAEYGRHFYIESIVKYYIAYFNAIDMMFANVYSMHGAVRINIAKIIIEDTYLPWNFLTDDELQCINIINKLSEYFYIHYLEYPQDSFDHVFIHTSRPLKYGLDNVDGVTNYGFDLYQARKFYQFYNVVPVTIVKFKRTYGDYAVTVREIGKKFNMDIQLHRKQLNCAEQCTIQNINSNILYYIQWSYNSVHFLANYLRINRDRCFLLNEPRSLRTPGISQFLSPNRQCQCFGYHSYINRPFYRPYDTVLVEGCMQPLQCKKIIYLGSRYESTVWPLDGTPCSANKVCWKGQCETLIN